MGRNNERNIKKHNDKLHKAQDKAKKAAMERKEKLKEIFKINLVALQTLVGSFYLLTIVHKMVQL